MAHSGRGRGPTYHYQPTELDGQSSTVNTRQSPQAGSSRLEALPFEIPAAIIDNLPPYEQCYGIDEWNERALLRDLKSLCRVSKRMDLIARPRLFRKVSITSARTLIAFFRALLEAGDLAAYVKEIILDVDLRQGLRSLSAVERGVLVQELNQRGLRLLSGRGDDSDVICLLFYEVLARAPNLRSVQMFIEGTNTRGRYFDQQYCEDLWMYFQPMEYFPFFSRIRDVIRAAARGVGPPFLPNLETLAFCGSKGTVFGVGVFLDFLDIPSLRCVKSINDDGNWCHIAPRPELYEASPQINNEQRPRRNINRLELCGSSACQHDFEDIAQLFPCLETLSITRNDFQPGRFKHYVSRRSRRDLSTALTKLTSLRTLEIDMYPAFDMTFTITRNLYRALMESLGSRCTLNLARLQCLEHIEVPLYVFANVALEDIGQMAAVPRTVLPRSLKSLVLLADCGGGHSPAPCWDSTKSALEFLEALGSDLRHLPHLKTVTYFYKDGSCGNPFWTNVGDSQENEETYDQNRSRLRGIRDAFRMHNVDFRLEWGGFAGRELCEI